MGVEVAERESAAVEEHRHRVRARSGVFVWGVFVWGVFVRPVHPHRNRSGRSVDAVILDPEVGMQRAPR